MDVTVRMLILRQNGSVVHHSSLVGSTILIRGYKDEVRTVKEVVEDQTWVVWCHNHRWEGFSVSPIPNDMSRAWGQGEICMIAEGLPVLQFQLDEVRLLTEEERQVAEVMAL